MNVVIAPDSFKETLSAKEVANAIEVGLKRVFKDISIIKVPLADGGEGTVEALVDASSGKIVQVDVLDPLQREIKAYYGLLDDGKTAVIEMATSSGLELLKEEEKNPMNTTTYGFGMLINHALEAGVKNFILGLGGSATSDCGIGMLQALGLKLFDKNNNELTIVSAKHIKDIVVFDTTLLDAKFKDINISVACDVKNPLCGLNGASFVFGKQKGASDEMVKELDSSLLEFAKLCEDKFQKTTKDIEGCGAAGGLGFALITFLNANLKSGIDIVMKQVNLEEKLKDASLVITGEGKIDSQTIQGKTPIGVAKLAKKYNKKVIAIAGCTSNDYEIVFDYGIDAVFDITPISMDFETIKKESKKNLELTAYNIAKVLNMK